MEEKKIINIILSTPLEKTFYYAVPQDMSEKVEVGMRVVVPFGRREVEGYVLNFVKESEVKEFDFKRDGLKSILKIVDKQAVLSDEFFALGRWIADYYACSWGEALSAIVPPRCGGKKRKLQKKEKKEMISKTSFFIPMPEQEKVLKPIRKCIDKVNYKTFLLHGISDSGKTEVYLQAIAQVLQKGKQALFLVPEISLTPQVIQQFYERFGEEVAIWHSHLSLRERYDTWEAVCRGDINVLIGTRSAVFAPFPDLGIIVIDEEHETSFKQEQKPMYHTREVAIFRARRNNAVLILGSATPSLESYYRAKEGEFSLICLEHRIEERKKPLVKIVDMAKELRRNNRKILSGELQADISEQIKESRQVILFMNRRGYFTTNFCRSCGYVLRCPRCSVAMVYHLKEEGMLCHYCNHKEKEPSLCPECGSKYMRKFGYGTEKIEEVVKKMFPSKKILRLDLDTAYKKNTYQKMFSLFKKGKIDILIGTQMIVKGFDFPQVTLVGVVLADTTLYLPSFRSAEMTFSLLTQVAGRAGRGNIPGKVIIQTYNPQHYSIQAAGKLDYISFYEQEIKFRKNLDYPPFKHLINLVVRGKNVNRVEKEIENLKSSLNVWIKRAGLNFIMLGPTPAPRAKLSGKFRWQILIKIDKGEMAKLVSLLRLYKCGGGLYLSIDVDPMNVL
jgi:primosomal protein N' (replication factor Y)